jgi:hypothetical protein
LDTGKDGRITAEEFSAGKASIEKVSLIIFLKGIFTDAFSFEITLIYRMRSMFFHPLYSNFCEITFTIV